jgi:hypothetical protein
MQRVRVLLGLLIAPLLPSLSINLYGLLAHSNPHPPLSSQIPMLFADGLIRIAYAVAFLAGIPFFLILRKGGHNQWWNYCAGGAVLGLLPALCSLGYGLFYGITFAWEAMIVVGFLYGGVSGLIFWLISICGAGFHRQR